MSTFHPLADSAAKVITRLESNFRPRRDRDADRAMRAAARVKAQGGSALDQMLAGVNAIAIANPAFNINLFKLRVETFIRRGADDPAVRARFGARARLVANLIFSSPQGEARGGVESRHALNSGNAEAKCPSGPVAPGASCRSKVSLAGVAPGPRAINIAIAEVDRLYRYERDQFRRFGLGSRLSVDVLAELRLILRLVRIKYAHEFSDALATVAGGTPCMMAAE